MTTNFIKNRLSEIIKIDNIITLHYFEYAKDYLFKGESHNFWEIAYVDKGSVHVTADNNSFVLKQGEAIFHKPNEFHTIGAMGDFANTVIISFESFSPAMSFFEDKVLSLNKNERDLIFDIIKEGKKAFKEPLNIVNLTKMTKNEAIEFGATQLIKLYLEELLISLVRTNSTNRSKEKLSTLTKNKSLDDIVVAVIEYLEKNVSKNVTLDDICNHFYFSKTYIKTLFKNKTGQGLISYFNELKLEEAKKLISDNEFSFTEISEKLSFSSVHYFSRCFKAYTNMTPTEYSMSIKAKGIL